MGRPLRRTRSGNWLRPVTPGHAHRSDDAEAKVFRPPVRIRSWDMSIGSGSFRFRDELGQRRADVTVCPLR